MNDPHVEALIYTVVHSDTVDYEKAKPLEYDGLRFKARIEDGSARFEMKEHFATVEEARAVVDPATLAWEISVGLKLGPGEFSLKFDRPEIIDRDPVPGVVELSTAVSLSIRATAIIHLARGAYPSFPLDLAVDPDVESMYRRYQDFRDNREPLASMAYFCLTVITGWGPGQKKAA